MGRSQPAIPSTTCTTVPAATSTSYQPAVGHGLPSTEEASRIAHDGMRSRSASFVPGDDFLREEEAEVGGARFSGPPAGGDGKAMAAEAGRRTAPIGLRC